MPAAAAGGSRRSARGYRGRNSPLVAALGASAAIACSSAHQTAASFAAPGTRAAPRPSHVPHPNLGGQAAASLPASAPAVKGVTAEPALVQRLSTVALLALTCSELGRRRLRRRFVLAGSRRKAAVPCNAAGFATKVSRHAGNMADKIRVAVNISRDTTMKLRNKGMTTKSRQELRKLEIQRKIAVLKGSKTQRYAELRDKTQNGETGKRSVRGQSDKEEEGRDEDKNEEMRERRSEEEGLLMLLGRNHSSRRRSKRDDDYEGGGEEALWQFERDRPSDGAARRRIQDVDISDDAQAIYSTEVAGASKASAKTLVETGKYFQKRGQASKACQLLEIARKRVDTEQIGRKIGFDEAVELDQTILWTLGDLYVDLKRPTLACEMFRSLRDSLAEGSQEQRTAEKRWATTTFTLATSLFGTRRFESALEVFEMLRERAKTSIMGDSFIEEVQLNIAMTLQEMGRSDDAMATCMAVKKKTRSSKIRTQAQFIHDVIYVGPSQGRMEELHEIWEQNFRLPSSSTGAVRLGTSAGLKHLSPRERAFKEWATEYWEGRLKSPLYYAFLTLWVCWPFAIPVVAMWNKGQIGVPMLW